MSYAPAGGSYQAHGRDADASDDEEYSSFDVDLGGAQRKELKAELRAARRDIASSRVSRDMLEMQVGVLRKLQKEMRVSTIVDQWKRTTAGPPFAAWRAFTMAARVNKAHSQRLAMISKEAEAKQAEADQLAARVARVKGNAQSKLTELSEANKQLAAALEQRELELRGVAAQGKHAAGVAAAAQAELDGTRARLAEAEARLQREARRSERRGAELSAALRMLSSADGDLRGEHEAAAAAVAREGLAAACCDGLRAETACLKAEAAAQRTLMAIEVPLLLKPTPASAASRRGEDGGGDGGEGYGEGEGEGEGEGKGVGKGGGKGEGKGEGEAEGGEVAVGEPVVESSAAAFWLPGVASPEHVELRRLRRSLLAAVFHGWADRVVTLRSARAEVERASRREELDLARAEAEQLGADLASERAARVSLGHEADTFASMLTEAHAEADGRASELHERVERAEARADADAAEACVRAALARGLLQASEAERSRLESAARQLEAQLRRGEEALLALVGQSRQVVELTSPSLSL